MAFEHNDFSGSLFANDRRSNDRQPTHTGSCKINGEEYWISAWVKEGAKGRFFSMSFTAKEDKRDYSQTDKPAKMDDFDDDIPF